MQNMQEGIESILQSIESYVKKNNEEYLSIRTIATNGWLIGAKYASIKKLVDTGAIKSFNLNLGSQNRQPIKKIHYRDLENYLLHSCSKL